MTYQVWVDGEQRDATPEEVAEIEALASAPPPVPASVSMRQARLALRRAGLLSTVKAYIDGADEDTQIEWEFATDVWRVRPVGPDLVNGIGAALGLTSDQIDALFIAAAAIP